MKNPKIANGVSSVPNSCQIRWSCGEIALGTKHIRVVQHVHKSTKGTPNVRQTLNSWFLYQKYKTYTGAKVSHKSFKAKHPNILFAKS